MACLQTPEFTNMTALSALFPMQLQSTTCLFRQLAITAICLLLLACDRTPEQENSDETPGSPLAAETLAVVVNDQDPLSQKITDYYIRQRSIPGENIIRVSFEPGEDVMRPEIFKALKADVDRQTGPSIQAYVLTWLAPYRVGCMSMTTAFAAGFSAAFCAQGCKPTSDNPYFDTDSRQPWNDFGWRPTMMLAGKDFDAVKALIDRGIAADNSSPKGTGYLVSTSDRNRNTRARFYQGIMMMQSDRLELKIIQRNTLKYRSDVLFYFTGLANVEGIETNNYLPGAITDHLTSASGKLTGGSRQMSSLNWLEAGATASYGSVVEPCSFVEKFPRPDIVINRYLNGESLIEAYWKSVKWPGQGIFIGEPLATPFRRDRSNEFDPTVLIK